MANKLNCAIYTRKSSEEGLEQEFNSLHAQRESCEAFIISQKHEGWKALRTQYDDGGFSGGTMDRPGLQKLLADIAAHRVNVVVVYKVDRLTRSLADFAKIIETFDGHEVSFVSVTQQFNTTSSMGRLTLNVLLSFAQFEREVTGERIRDKIAASKQRGMWMGGCLPLGYDSPDRKLIINETEAKTVRHIFKRYLELGCVRTLKSELEKQGYQSKIRTSIKGNISGGKMFERGALYAILKNRIYRGDIVHKDRFYPGEHQAIVDLELWQAVQDKLEQNRVSHKQGKGFRNPSLLAGRLFDNQGQRLTPSHAQKGDRRYRYYIGGASNMRLPASEVETAVLSELKLFLKTPQILTKELVHKNDDVGTQQSLTEGGKQQAEAIKFSDIQNIIQRVEIGKQTLTLTCSKSKVRNWLLNENCTTDETFTLTTKFTLRRRGVETKFIIDNEKDDQNPVIDRALVKAVAKAYSWNKRLVDDEVKSIRELAIQEDVTHGYIRKLLPLAFLSPEIVKMILAGHQPRTLSLSVLLQTDMPQDWNAQSLLIATL